MATAPTDTVSPEQTLQYQIALIEAMTPAFQQFLVPSEIMSWMSFDECTKEEIKSLEERGRRNKAAKDLVDLVLESPQDHLSLFIAALRRVGFERFINILDDKPDDKEQNRAAERYEYLLRMLEGELIKVIIPSQIVDQLVPILGQGDAEEIRSMEDRRGEVYASQHLFLCMKRKTPTWPLKFLEAVCNSQRRLLAKIDPALAGDNMELDGGDDDDDNDGDDLEDDGMSTMSGGESMMSTQASVNSDTAVKDVYVAPQDGSIDMSSMSLTRAQRLERLQSQVADNVVDDFTPNFSDEEKQDDEDAEKDGMDVDAGQKDLNLRDYQIELAENAVLGRNTIICAPTGSGKTRVALHIVKDHLDKEEKGKRKVVFLARTVPLVNQQYNTFFKYLNDRYRISKLSGEDEHSSYLHQYLDNFDVIVMTPQILENQFKEGKIKSLSVFSLVVLDECHHTRKGEPYNNLMLRYLKEKNKKKTQPQPLPQIVGLTASLGVEKATVDEEAINNILRLCANMDAPFLSTVVKHIDELRAKVPVPDEKTVRLTENRQDPARKELEKVMKKIEDLMIDINDLNDKQIDSLLMKCPNDRNSQPYGQWAVQLKNETRLVQTGHRDNLLGEVDPKRAEMARSLFVMADHLFRYNAALEIHDIVRIKDVIEYLQKEFTHNCLRTLLPGGANVHVPCEEKLDELFSGLKKSLMKFELKRKSDPNHDNPNLKVLAKTLKTLLEEKGEDSRAIVFVRTRATCYALANWLNDDELIDEKLKDMKAMAFTGAGANEEEGGMTQKEQDKVISKFKSGQIKMIVATSVAEEGLDIPECNIVLKYNHVGNEITTVQTRGRSRKSGGTSVLLGNSKIQQKEMLNVARASMMQRAIQAILQMPQDRILRRIQDHQQESLDKEAIKEEVRRHLTNKKVDVEFSLICACCRKFCTKGSDMRIINGNQHVVIDKEFKDRIVIHPFSNQKTKSFDGITMTGSMQCKGCHKPWGVKFIYQGVSFYSLGIKYFIVNNHQTKTPQYFKKWMELPYVIRAITTQDFKTFLGSEDAASDDDEDEFDLC